MRIKNFSRFVNENLNPHSSDDKSIKADSRKGEPIFYDDDEFSDQVWTPTGDKPRKQKPDSDYSKDDLEDEEDEIDPKGPDKEPFVSDTDDDSEVSDQDYIY